MTAAFGDKNSSAGAVRPLIALAGLIIHLGLRTPGCTASTLARRSRWAGAREKVTVRKLKIDWPLLKPEFATSPVASLVESLVEIIRAPAANVQRWCGEEMAPHRARVGLRPGSFPVGEAPAATSPGPPTGGQHYHPVRRRCRP